jgi:hypothetical protein
MFHINSEELGTVALLRAPEFGRGPFLNVHTNSQTLKVAAILPQ